MRILLTGGSSFTGYWLIRELSRSGHEVVATFREPLDKYSDPLRKTRVEQAASYCRPVEGMSFGDDAFIELCRTGGFDTLCHHAADVTNYKSPDFDAVTALSNNTRNIQRVMQGLTEGGCLNIVVTGSVFENDEGAGSDGLPAFSPYGLSKSLTWQMFRYYAKQANLGVGKFVIPNPFGPYEESRFTAYLMKTWAKGNLATVGTPAYIRDNIQVQLLAKAYALFVEQLPESGQHTCHPSGYIESQGAFAGRFASEMRKRLPWKCDLELKNQTEFPEPRIRVNTETPEWSAAEESAAWDEIAEYYSRILAES